jgi:hypothetical protein
VKSERSHLEAEVQDGGVDRTGLADDFPFLVEKLLVVHLHALHLAHRALFGFARTLYLAFYFAQL